jgi:hypothetical protein
VRKCARIVIGVVVGLVLPCATICVYILVVGSPFRPADTDKLDTDKLKALRVKADLAGLSAVCTTFRSDYGRWPASPEELLDPLFSPKGSRFEYLSRPALDPWTGAPFTGRILLDSALQIVSLGADRAPGGEGPALDIVV